MIPFLIFMPQIACAANFALSQSQFINPPEQRAATPNPSSNSVYRVGDVVDISWSTTEEVVTLVINQLNSSLTEIDYLPNSVALTQNSYIWKVTIDGSDGGSNFDLTFNNQFNLMLFHVNSSLPFAQSASFNITDATVDQHGNILPITRTSAASATATIRSTTPTTSTSTTAVLPPVASSSASTTSDAAHIEVTSTSTTKVVLGAVLGVGGLVVVVLGTVVYLFLRQKERGQQIHNNHPPQYPTAPYQKRLQNHGYGEWKPQSELHTSETSILYASELPS